MIKLLSTRTAAYGLILIQSLVLVFHFLVLFGVVPFEIVWGGRLKSAEEMRVFESVSIILNTLMIAVVAIYAGLLPLNVNRKMLRFAFWVMFVLFALNTAGNLLAVNEYERMIFTPLTFLLAVFSLRLALSKPVPAPNASFQN
ncbi:hypothetical protein [Adhaeribacter soli]|uniref:DUF4345 domain-containing protein n=1 Tax=Adhaeribacter soli TaxID=2607655 RepID=A0A5N1ISC5_9BACT|nr:hypothetical protein [Adhaeribacter soli]KAA9332867.1 hypothetical protein F0P94_12800 [Adhaeribacter soli]